MKYCSHCGSEVEFRIPDGDNLPRHICLSCKTIHYQNPKIIAGAIPEWDNSILLCRRAIEPRHGLWTLPAGFMENNETTAEAAVRETLEEAQAQVEPISLFALFDIPHISQVYIMYRARLLEHKFSAGSESLEVALFREQDIPWDQLAFPVINETLQRYFKDREQGQYQLHLADIQPRK